MTMSVKVLRELLNRSKLDGELGIEIEAESTIENYPQPTGRSSWSVKGDGSLRYYGVEYITRDPIKFSALSNKIEEIFNVMKKGSWIKDSPRTSAHVHCSVLEHTPTQIYNALCIYWLLENVLFKMCGPGREGNLFCMRLKDASGILNILQDDVEKAGAFFSLRGDYYRYGGVNCNAIIKFGSLEYRGMSGTDDPTLLGDWCTLMHLLTQSGKFFKDPIEMFDKMFAIGYDKFFSDILGESLFKKVKDSVKQGHWEELVEENVELLSSFVYDTPWNNLLNITPKNNKVARSARQILDDINIRPDIAVNQVQFQPDEEEDN